MLSASSFLRKTCWPLGCALCLLWSSVAPAQTIDVSLNVFYANSLDVNSGGTWEVVAKSGNFGVAGLSVLLTNITTAQLEGPRGTVNGSDPAGFSEFSNTSNPLGFRNIVTGQVPALPSGGQEEAIFYGVGTLTNGAPDYPSKPPGSNSIGPVFISLTDVMDVAWATGDAFSNPTWNTAARLASGTFSTGVTPGFFQGSGHSSSGNVFTTLGTSTTYGTITEAFLTTTVRSNFLLPDYNENGVVDAADYVLWRDTFGLTGAGLPADGNNNGSIDQGDYDVWRANFGAIVGAGAGSSVSGSAVPEPAGAALLTIGTLFAISPRRWRRAASAGEAAAATGSGASPDR